MNSRSTIIVIVVMILISSCHMDLFNDDLTIVNKTTNPLYYKIDVFGTTGSNVKNFAYEQVTDLNANKTRYELDNAYEILPDSVVHPSIRNDTWKHFAASNKGITILFYKKDIEKLSPLHKLPQNYIERRIDLTARQLDSCKYIITL